MPLHHQLVEPHGAGVTPGSLTLGTFVDWWKRRSKEEHPAPTARRRLYHGMGLDQRSSPVCIRLFHRDNIQLSVSERCIEIRLKQNVSFHL